MATTSELIEQAQDIVSRLNAALTTSYQTTGTYITGRIVLDHYDKYHHANMTPNPSVDSVELVNADTSTQSVLAELNAIIPLLHDAHVDISGYLNFGHQAPGGVSLSRPSVEVTGITLNFEDKDQHVAFCASTKLPIDVAENPEHKAEVALMQARYDQFLAAKTATIPPDHYRPGQTPPEE